MTISKFVLGHAVSSNGIEVNETKVEVISNLPSLKTVREVRFFLDVSGFIGGLYKKINVIFRKSLKR